MTVYERVKAVTVPIGVIEILWNEVSRGRRPYVDHDESGNVLRRHIHTYNGKETKMTFKRRVDAGLCIVTQHGIGSSPSKPTLTELEYLALINHTLMIDDAGNLQTDQSGFIEV